MRFRLDLGHGGSVDSIDMVPNDYAPVLGETIIEWKDLPNEAKWIAVKRDKLIERMANYVYLGGAFREK